MAPVENVPRASEVLTWSGAGRKMRIWMGGAHSHVGEVVTHRHVEAAWVLDTAGDLAPPFEQRALRLEKLVFADLDARPGQYERLEALTRRWATELRTPQLQSSPSDIYVFCQYGMNRSGLAAGLLMRELGVEASEVLRRIRRARPGSLSNHSFVRLIEEWQPG